MNLIVKCYQNSYIDVVMRDSRPTHMFCMRFSSTIHRQKEIFSKRQWCLTMTHSYFLWPGICLYLYH